MWQAMGAIGGDNIVEEVKKLGLFRGYCAGDGYAEVVLCEDSGYLTGWDVVGDARFR